MQILRFTMSIIDRVVPPTADPVERKRARFLVGACIALLPPYLLVFVAMSLMGDALGQAASAAAIVLSVIIVLAVGKQQTQVGATIAVGGAVLLGSVGAIPTGGIQSPAYAANVVALTLSAVLLGRSGTVLTLAGVLSLTALQGLFPVPATTELPPGAAIYIWAITLFASTGLVAGMVSLTEEMITQAETDRAHLTGVVAELRETGVNRDYVAGVLGALREFIIVTDGEQRIREVNASVERIGGWTIDELRGRRLSVLLGDDGEAASPMFHRKDGTSIPVTVSRGALSERRQVWAATDITPQHQAATALREANSRVQAASLAKSNFLANMSHELRTPLNAIIGYGELLSDEITNESQRADLGKIGGAARALLELINGVLDLSKIEAGKIDVEFENTTLEAVTDGVLDLIGPMAEAKGLELSSELVNAALDENIFVDRGKLRQVLINLLTNAVKFTPAGSVSLTTERWERSALPWLRFTIADTGIGMTGEQLETIFEPFSQVDSSETREIGGTGLGLSICSAFVEMMGGQIYADSTPGEGTRFVVEIPSAEYSALTPANTPSAMMPAGDAARERIMVIDDDPAFLELVTRILAADGRQIVSTTDGREGLAWADRFQADAILLDIAMPSLSGWGFLVRLQATRSAHSPVLVVTGEGDAEVAKALGAVGVLTKPVDPGELRERVAELLR